MPTKQHAPSVKPRRLHLPAPDLHTTVSRVVGYYSVCRCGWLGSARKLYEDAQEDGRQHRAEMHE